MLKKYFGEITRPLRAKKEVCYVVVVLEKPGLGRKETVELIKSIEKMTY